MPDHPNVSTRCAGSSRHVLKQQGKEDGSGRLLVRLPRVVTVLEDEVVAHHKLSINFGSCLLRARIYDQDEIIICKGRLVGWEAGVR